MKLHSSQSSSEENMQRLQIEHHLSSKSLSAEILMSRPRFPSRFLDLADGRDTQKPCVCGLTTKAEVTSKSHRRTMSDVVRTETSLNYGIITRAPDREKVFHAYEAEWLTSLFQPQTAAKPVPESSNQSKAVTTVKDSIKITGSGPNDRITSSQTSSCERNGSKKGVTNDGSRLSPTNNSTKNSAKSIKVRRKSAEKIHIDMDAITKRWEEIKEKERKKLKEEGQMEPVTLIYEVSTRRKSLSAIETRNHKKKVMIRTLSDTRWIYSEYCYCYSTTTYIKTTEKNLF